MSRLSAQVLVFLVAFTLFVLPSLAQSPTGGAKSEQTVQQKMKNSEDPSSPAMQQAAAKQADCKKQAKAQKLSGAKRRAFINDCAK